MPPTRPNLSPWAVAAPRKPPASWRRRRRWNACKAVTMDELPSHVSRKKASQPGTQQQTLLRPRALGGGEGGAPTMDKPRRAPWNGSPRVVIELLQFFLLALTIMLFVITFVVQAFRIPSGSMEDTLLVGDYLLVDKTCFGPAGP